MTPLLLVMVLGVDPAARALEAGKPAKAVKKAEKLLESGELLADEQDAVELTLGEARFQLAQDPLDLELWLAEFPRHPRAPEAREGLAQDALRRAEAHPTEASFLAASSAWPDTRAGAQAHQKAQEAGRAGALEAGSAAALRAWRLRYDDDSLLAEEQGLAWAEVEADGSPDAWEDLALLYPQHPQVEQARTNYRAATRDATSDGAAALWDYAMRFPDSPEGWEAATKAIDSASWGEEQQGLLGLTVHIGGAPPPGYQLELVVEVDGVPWAEASAVQARALGLEAAASTRVVREGSRLTWSTDLPPCSTEEAQARLSLSYGDRVHAFSHPLEVSRECRPAERMVFLQLGDDLMGPVALLRHPDEQEKLAETALPEAAECSHVQAVDGLGVAVSCGPVLVRVGWEGESWARLADPKETVSYRVELEPTEAVRSKERQPVATPPSPERAFGMGMDPGPPGQGPRTALSLEPLPKESAQAWLRAWQEVFGTNLRLVEAVRFQDQELYLVLMGGTPAIFVGPPGTYAWRQLLVLETAPPDLGLWQAWEQEGRASLQTRTLDGHTLLLWQLEDGRMVGDLVE